MDQCLEYAEPEPELPEPARFPGAKAGAGAFKSFYLEPEPEPKCIPRAGAGAVKKFHGTASLHLAGNRSFEITMGGQKIKFYPPFILGSKRCILMRGFQM